MVGGAAQKTGSRANVKRAKPQVILATFPLVATSKSPIRVQHLDAPPRYARRERIHPRRVLPRVKEGREREFHSVTRELTYHLQGTMRATTDDLTLLTNSELAQPGQRQLASSVDEPSVAAAGDVVVYTGNWYAARSID